VTATLAASTARIFTSLVETFKRLAMPAEQLSRNSAMFEMLEISVDSTKAAIISA
jgi:hypothetical protein